jgi:hypothetical protein
MMMVARVCSVHSLCTGKTIRCSALTRLYIVHRRLSIGRKLFGMIELDDIDTSNPSSCPIDHRQSALCSAQAGIVMDINADD